jgi:uncharacterized membrane protein
MRLGAHLRNGFLFQSLAGGLLLWLALKLVGLSTMDALMFSWCAHVLVHGTWLWRRLACAEPDEMRRRAQEMAEGRRTVLAIALLAASVAIATVVAELVMQKQAAAWERALAVATIILSWCHVHLLFAQDYAHEYWTGDEGLDFPGGDGTPEFSEFCYVALMVGTTSQVSDTKTTTPAMRRLVMLHASVAFAFNAVILASSVNVLAGLAGE